MGASPLMATRPQERGCPGSFSQYCEKPQGSTRIGSQALPWANQLWPWSRITEDCGCPNRRRSWRKGREMVAEEVGSCLERSRGARMTRLEIPPNAPSVVLLPPGPRALRETGAHRTSGWPLSSSGTPISPWQRGHGRRDQWWKDLVPILISAFLDPGTAQLSLLSSGVSQLGLLGLVCSCRQVLYHTKGVWSG